MPYLCHTKIKKTTIIKGKYMEKKYKLTDECIKLNDRKLYRIEAIRNFGYVTKGQKGGFIESESNLSHDGNAWVFGDAKVFGNAHVCGNAWVSDNAKVSGDAWVSSNAKVFGNACVFCNVYVIDNAKVFGNAWVYGNARIYGNAKVYGDAVVYGDSKVYGDSNVSGDSKVFGCAYISGNAYVCEDDDYIVFKNWWSSRRYFTWTRSNNMWRVGCFYGTGEELIKKAYADSENSGAEYERVVKYVESILK